MPVELPYRRRPWMVAEVSSNHLGSLVRAKQLVMAAAGAGADAVKFQVYRAEQMAKPGVIVQAGACAGKDALELYREAETPREWLPELFAVARQIGIVPFASVFHPNDVDDLERLNCPVYKIASFELTETALIQYTALRGKPIVMSTGMATVEEVYRALTAAREFGAKHITLLKCTSAYPAPVEDCNLAAMGMLRYHDCAVGLSDHTHGIGVAVAAAALGAQVIEKHLTLRREDGGPDSSFSMEPEEFRHLVIECRRAAAAIGQARLGPTLSELPMLNLRRPPAGYRGEVNGPT